MKHYNTLTLPNSTIRKKSHPATKRSSFQLTTTRNSRFESTGTSSTLTSTKERRNYVRKSSLNIRPTIRKWVKATACPNPKPVTPNNNLLPQVTRPSSNNTPSNSSSSNPSNSSNTPSSSSNR